LKINVLKINKTGQVVKRENELDKNGQKDFA
jgi:hypothetical protein